MKIFRVVSVLWAAAVAAPVVAEPLMPVAKVMEEGADGVSLVLAFEAPEALDTEKAMAALQESVQAALDETVEDAAEGGKIASTIKAFLYPTGAVPEGLPGEETQRAAQADIWYMRDPAAAGWNWSLDYSAIKATALFDDCTLGGPRCNAW